MRYDHGRWRQGGRPERLPPPSGLTTAWNLAAAYEVASRSGMAKLCVGTESRVALPRKPQVFIPDLHEFEAGHRPTVYGQVSVVRDGTAGYGVLPRGVVLRTTGWLGATVPTVGDIPEDCLARLVAAFAAGYWFGDGMKGGHDCEVCCGAGEPEPHAYEIDWKGERVSLDGRGHFLVASRPRLWRRSVVYIYPELMLHYVMAHRYRPPDEFLDALRHGRFLSEADLVFVETAPSD